MTLRLERILAETPDLPAMPAAAARVIQVTGSSDANAQAVADALSLDQALAARVLRLVNSAHYGLSRQVSVLKEAVVVLGMRSVRNLAMVATALPWLNRPLPGYELGPKQLLLHAAATSIGAQMIARVQRSPLADQAFVAGLLVDVGKLVLSRHFEGKVALMVSLGIEAGMTYCEVERRAMGVDHADVGAAMADSWHLPADLVAAIQYHHDPNSAPEEFQALADFVHIADYLTMVCGFGIGGDGLFYTVQQEAFQRRGLSTDDLDGLIDEFVIAYEHQESLLTEIATS